MASRIGSRRTSTRHTARPRKATSSFPGMLGKLGAASDKLKLARRKP